MMSQIIGLLLNNANREQPGREPQSVSVWDWD